MHSFAYRMSTNLIFSRTVKMQAFYMSRFKENIVSPVRRKKANASAQVTPNEMAAMTDEKQVTGSGKYPATGTTGPGKPTGPQEKESHCCLSQQCLANIAIQIRGSRARKEGRRRSLHST